MFVEQHVQTEAPEFSNPRSRPRVVLVIAGDQKCAMAGSEPAQRSRMTTELANGSVDDITGDRNEIGTQAIDRIHDRIDILLADRMAHVHIADLSDGKSMQRFRQVQDRYIHVDDART